MKIFSISFNKKDYLYSINYMDGGDTRMVATNDQALPTLREAIGEIRSNIRAYAKVDDSFYVDINTVRYGESDDTVSFSLMDNSTWPLKDIDALAKIPHIKQTENNPETIRISLLLAIDKLRGEIELFLSGKREQKELFENEE